MGKKSRAELEKELETAREKLQAKEQQLQKTRHQLNKFNEAIEQSPAVVAIADTDGKLEFVNPQFTRITGYSREELIGKNPSILQSGYHEEEFYEELWATITRGETWEGEFKNKRKNGEFYWEEASIAPVEDENGEIIRYIKVAEDITDRREMLRELRMKDQALANSPSGVAFTSLDGTVIEVNKAFLELWGIDDEGEALGRHLSEFFKNPNKVEEIFVRILEDSKWQGELTGQRLNGEEFEIAMSSSPIKDEGEVFAVMGIHQDITERKKALRELEETQKNLKNEIEERKKTEQELRELTEAIEQSPATVMITDIEGKIEYVNPKFAELTGYEPEEVEGLNPRFLQSGKHNDQFYSKMWDTLLAGKTWNSEFCNRNKAGELYWEDASIAPVTDKEGEITHFIKVAEDITTRRKMRRNLEKLNSCFLNFSPDPKENFNRIVEVCGQLLEADAAFYNCVSGDKLICHAAWNEPEDFKNQCEAEGHICTRVVLENLGQIRVMNDLQETEFAQTDPTVKKYNLKTYAGKAVRPEEEAVGSLCVVFTEDVELSFPDKTVLEIAVSALESEEQRYQLLEELQDSNRQLKQFANLAAHDLKQPLRTVTSYLELLVRRYEEELPEKAIEYIEKATSGTYNMRKLLDGLLDYSKVNTGEENFQRVETHQLVDEIVADLKTQLEENKACVEYDELPDVEGDRTLLARVFQNLISNALTYRSEGDPLIKITSKDKGQMIEFAVADNGMGMEPSETGKIFKLFKRLHSDDEIEGTGIGLAICRKVVEQHGGEIWVESEPKEGSTFYFTLPAGG